MNTLTNLYPIPFRVTPLNNITPFTYRDGTNFMELLESMRVYINDEYRPAFDAELTRVINEFNEGIENAENYFTTTKAAWDAAHADFMANVNANISILNEDLFIARKGRRGVTRTIYVRATGVDTNDGKTSGTAFREIKTAVASLASEGPIILGTVVIDVGAGTYKGGIRFPSTRGSVGDDFIYIKGPAMDHPSVPTAIIDWAADTTATYGFMGEDSCHVFFEDIKTIGAFSQHFTLRRDGYYWFKNVHSDGQKVGTSGGKVGWNIMQNVHYAVIGGRIENMVENGVEELFGVTRSYDGQTSEATALYIRNCDTGFLAKEGCVGHVDWVQIEDCATGFEFNGDCVTNLKAVTLKRNGVGMVVANSEVHNELGIRWGTGVDANLRDWITLGMGMELATTGWGGSATARTMKTGHRPLIVVGNTYTPVTHTGTTEETQVINFAALLKARRYNTAGKKFRVVLRGITNNLLAGNVRLMLRAGGKIMTDLPVLAATAANTRFKIEYEVTCTADGNFQLVTGELFTHGLPPQFTDPARAEDHSTVDFGIAISVINANAADSITIKSCEVWG